MVFQLGNVPVDVTVGQDDDRVIIGVAVLGDVPQVGAVVGMGITGHQNVSFLGVQHILQRQRDALPLGTAVASRAGHVPPAIREGGVVRSWRVLMVRAMQIGAIVWRSCS